MPSPNNANDEVINQSANNPLFGTAVLISDFSIRLRVGMRAQENYKYSSSVGLWFMMETSRRTGNYDWTGIL